MEKMTYNQYTKHYIVEALSILLENKDFADITVKEIVEKAGVGRATFYRNFPDKESVLIYKFQLIGKAFGERIENSKFIPYYTRAEIEKEIASLEKDLQGISEDDLKKICEDVVAQNQVAVNDYHNGKEAAFKSLVGGVMKATRGKADARLATEILKSLVD